MPGEHIPESERQALQSLNGVGEDAPAKIIEDIDKQLKWWERKPELLSYTPEGRRVLKRQGIEHRPDGPTDYPEKEARDFYRAFRKRALAFVNVAPSLARLLVVRDDPILGIQDIRATFAAILAESSAGSPPHDPLAEEVRNAVEALRQAGKRDRAAFLELFIHVKSKDHEDILEDLDCSDGAMRESKRVVNRFLAAKGYGITLDNKGGQIHLLPVEKSPSVMRK